MPAKPQIIAAFDVVAQRHDITNPDRVITTRRWRNEFFVELNITDDEQAQNSVLHQLLNLRKSKKLTKHAALSTQKAAS